MSNHSHSVIEKFNGKRTWWDTCQHWSYPNRQLRQCGAPTEGGKPTCKECQALEARGAGYQRRDVRLVDPR